jgi:LL-diaminopimelate aminotransferase
VLIPAVHYPVYARAPQLAGARAVAVPVDAAGMLQLDQVPAEALARARMLVVNYPSNPTTATATLEELGRLLAFAEAHDLLVVSDLAYSELGFDGYAPPSLLQVAGTRARVVELHTCSKSFNMAGVRIGVMVGNRDVLDLLDAYRSNIGYGASTLAQVAGAAAFAHHATLVPPIVAEYRARRDAFVAALGEGGWAVTPPRASMYFWLPIPGGHDDWGWVDALLDGPGVVVTPGIAFGEAGRGHFRVSLVQPPDRLRQAAAGLVATAARSVG